MPTTFTRQDLERSFPNLTPKVRAALEEIPVRLQAALDQGETAVAATQGINNATVIVLSANDAFGNERVLSHGPGLVFQDGGVGGRLTIGLANNLTFNGGFSVTFNLRADTNVDLPNTGTLLVDADFPGPYADDAAAGAAGVSVGGFYKKTGGALAWRVA